MISRSSRNGVCRYNQSTENEMDKLTHLSLCSGIGGLDLAAEWAGFKTIGQCEIDDYASRVLAKNFKGVPNFHDIRTVTNERLAEHGIKPGSITVVSAGFPCQPYSLAGKGLGDSDERDLWGEVARVLKEFRPQWFVGENTPGLFSRENQRYFRRILNDLTSLGYRVGWGIWGACDVGAPHKRNRIFIIAYANSKRCIRIYKNIEKKRTTMYLPTTSPRTAWENIRAYKEIDRIFCILRNTPEPYSEFVRDDNGIPYELDRIKCNGNAVVPQQAYPIFEAIAKIELLQG